VQVVARVSVVGSVEGVCCPLAAGKLLKDLPSDDVCHLWVHVAVCEAVLDRFLARLVLEVQNRGSRS